MVGIPPQPRWREMLLKLSDDVLREVKTIPENTFYRVSTENNFKFFQKVLHENDDYEVVEEIINRGQVEEMIMMFEDELEIIPFMAREKPWIITKESAEAAKAVEENGEDFVNPSNYVKPNLEFKTWSGIYNVIMTDAEFEELKRKEAELKEKQAAAAQAQKK
jgi:hypothetical protein